MSDQERAAQAQAALAADRRFRRERIATAAMKGILAGHISNGGVNASYWAPDALADFAIDYADALMQELEK